MGASHRFIQHLREGAHMRDVNLTKRNGVAEATPFQGVGEPCWFHSAAAKASVAFLAPIQATTPKPILLMMSAML